jgi:tricorn protease
MRRTLTALLATAALILLAAGVQAEPIKFARYPHFGGGKLAFTYHGDIWVANADGSNPYRLTAHIADDRMPKFSPDGKWVAFTSNRMGNNDVYVVAVAGGEPRQLTFGTMGHTALYWTPDGKGIVTATSIGPDPWGTPLYIVPLDGSIPTPMDMDRGAVGMIKQDNTMVAFNRNGFTYWRKGYRGNNNTDIWVQDLKTKKITQLTDADIQQFRQHTQDAYPMWGADGMIYFMSERDGIFNIWKIAPTGGAPVQVTNHRADGVQYPSISPDGRTIVYENEFEIWRLDVPDGRPQKITLDLAFDPKFNTVEYLPTQNNADGFTVSPEGDYVAVDFHGEVFVVPSDPEVGEKKQVTASGWREWRELWSPDGKWIAYVSDETGEDEQVWVWEAATGKRSRLSRHESLKEGLTWTPDSKSVLWEGENRLFLSEVPGGRTTEVAYNEAGGFSVSGFSADGKWLVYSRSDEHQNSDVYLYEIAAKREYDVTSNPWRDSGGQLTPDGRWLVFTSNREGGVNHLYKVSLTRVTEDPDDPLVRERAAKAAGERTGGERTGERAGRAAGGEAAPAAPPAIRIDLEGIDRRATALTSGAEGVGSWFLSKDGKLVYFTSRDDKGPALFSIGLDGQDRRSVSEGSFGGLTPTTDGKMVFYRQGQERTGQGAPAQARGGGGQGVWRMTLATKRKEQVRFNLTVTVDKPAEWRQLFMESWRIMKYRFYDPKMHGRDWLAIRKRYEPLLPYVGQNQDVYDLSNEMIGELNASHTGVSGPSGVDMPDTYRTRYPGFEMRPEGGRYRITHVYRDGPADKEWLDLKVGDFVLALDGRELKAGENYWPILNHTLNDYVTVRVATDASGRNAREVRVRALPSLGNIMYEEWVYQRRKMVEEWSGGRIAYVHIRSMNGPSLERFQNEINQYWDAQGIVVDIRYNGGGNTDQEILDLLERRPYEFWNSRSGVRSWGRRPRQAIAGPKVMLINWRSASDSEVTPLGFRDLGLGRIVGTPTYGAVIATGSYRLINGGSIRTPGSLVVSWDPTKPNNYGIILENYGVAPDVFAENTPDDELKSFDRELKAAVDEALRMLAEGTWQYGIKK